MKKSLIFLILPMFFVLGGCESAEEKAERQRQEKLLGMNEEVIAADFVKSYYGSQAYAENYRAIKKLCIDENATSGGGGKWCGKLARINSSVKMIEDAKRPKIIVD